MNQHEVFNCPSNWPLNDVQSYSGGNTYVYEIYCSGVDGKYSFRIDGLVLEKINNEWQVVGWDMICERYPDEEECYTVLEP